MRRSGSHWRRPFGWLVLGGLLALTFVASDSRAAIAVSPAYVEVRLDEGRPAGQFTIANIGDEEERYRIGATHFIFTRDGALRTVKPDEHSLVPWIKFNPPEFTVAPKTQRVIRFVIVPQGPLKAGEYWAAMELESLRASVSEADDGHGRQLKLQIVSSILVPMFGTVGNVQHQAAVQDVRMSVVNGRQKIEFMVNNTGAGKLLLNGSYVIKDTTGQAVRQGTIVSSYILPASERFVPAMIDEPLDSGTYTVHVECHSKQMPQPMAGDFQVVWKRPAP
jgi:P pilus assembly chaperone PapD